MKRLFYFLIIFLMFNFIFTSCNKNDNPVNDATKSMDELVVSNDFDWKTTKTIDVIITLPTDDYSQIINIFSTNGEELYYSGYASNNNVLSTIITIPTSVTSAIIVYSFDQLADQIHVDVGNELIFDYSTSKSLFKEISIDDCGCEGGLFSLTMQYTGSVEANIKVREKKNDVVIYCGVVAPDAEFTITGGSKKDGRFDNTIYFFIEEVQNTTMHVSCSVTLEAGDPYGDFIIVSGISRNNLPLCGTPPDPPPPPPPPADPPETTTVTFNGCLAYEDLWPGKGDYDFNDLILNYEFYVTKDNNDYILNITGVFTIYAFGASFHNGFGYVFPNVNPNQLISVSGYEIEAGGIFNLASNGLEANQSKATIIVYDDSYNIMPHPGGSIGVNTVESAPYVEPDSVVIQMVFFDNGAFASGGPVTFADLDIGNFNPFIIVNQDRGVEVHLLDFAPTDLADPSLFGTSNDDSNPPNRYYTTSNNLPWAINIPIIFEYPIEKQEITSAYLHFGEWAESEGVSYPDWYENLTGYRNDSKIYTPPSTK